MIEWKVYDKNNPPEQNVTLLIKLHGGVTSGELNMSDSCRLTWFSYNGNSLSSVTHYAEINLPNDKPDPDEGYIYCPNCGRVKDE